MYNVELYIEQCLLSCLKQNLSSSCYEIIIINDGSTDNSLKIAEHIACLYNNIKIYSQKNAGLSEARNTGLKYAVGKYIWFVDSDDRIRENCLKQLLEQCESESLDILALAASDVVDGNEVRRFHYSNCKVLSGRELLELGEIQHCVPFSIYRRSFFVQHKLQFYPGIFHEDSEFSPRAYYYANRVGFTNKIIYLVTINPNSITRTVNYKKSFDCLTVARSMHLFYVEEARSLEPFFNNYISLIINNSLANFLNPPVDKTALEKAKNQYIDMLYKNRLLFKYLRNSSKLKYRVEGVLFTMFPRRVITIYKFLQIFK